MKIINRLLQFIMIIGTIIIAILNISNNNYSRVLTYVCMFPVLLIPFILNKTKLKLNNINIFVFNIFIFLAQFLGCVVNLYSKLSWYDLFMHFMSGFLSFFVAIFILRRISNYDKKNVLLNSLFIFGIVFLIAGLWEIIEFGSDKLLNLNLQHNLETGVNDTMEDILSAFIGSILAYIPYLIKSLINK